MEKRHHVHVCYAAGDLIAERSLLAQRLAKYCFFTWSLEDTNSVSAGYTRQQIDDCDYVIFLVGGRYGTLSVSGVSYLHLDFIYTSTKKKPMIVMVHANPDLGGDIKDVRSHQNQRKLEDFRAQLEKNTQKINYFSSVLEFANKLVSSYNALVTSEPAHGWVHAEPSLLEHKVQFNEPATQEVTGTYAAVSLGKVNLNDICRFNYQVHAFEGGNFTEVMVSKEMAWGDILSTVAERLKMPAPEDAFTKVLNERLDKDALADVKPRLPNAHAATRSQISLSDLAKIKAQFFTNDWIKIAETRSGSGRRLLMLTPQGARNTAQWQSVVARMN